MSTLRSYRPVAVLLLLTLWPSLGLAQSAPPAGVVTGLQGQASLIRPVIAQPIPLKFKDDLFLRDQVQTREKSVARVLLGGKALVTIRELSTFAITEEPGRAAINLKSGKIAVGVAKSLLKPGEAIEIHTPNAIAAVRGSLLVASVVISAGVPQTTFTALDASLPITVTPLGGSAAPVALNANQAVGVSGLGASTAVGPVQNVTPDVARREAQTASAPQTTDGPGVASPMAGEISAAKFQEATALASLIAPPSTGATPPPADSTLASATQTQLLQESSSTLNATTQTVVASTPPPPSTGDLGVNAISISDAVASSDSSTSENNNSPPPSPVPPPPTPTPPPTPPPPANGPIVINNQNLVLGAPETVKTFSGQSFSTETVPWVTVNNSTVSGADNLIVVEPGTNATLAGSLLNVTDSTINTNNRLFSMDGGSLTSSTTSPFLFFDPSTVTTGGGTILLLNGSNLSLAGPLVSAQTTALAAGNPALNSFSLLTVLDGSSLTSTSTAPLLSFDGSSFDGGAVVSVRRSVSTLNRSTLALSGPLFAAVNESFFNTSSLGLGPTLGTTGGPCCSLVSVTQGGQLSSTTSNPLIQVSGSTVNAGPDAQSGGPIVNIADTFGGAPAAELVAPASVTLVGPLLRSDNSTLTALFQLLRVANSSLTSATPDPLVQLNSSTVALGGLDPFTNVTSVARLLNLSGTAARPATLTLAGPLFSVLSSTVTTTDDMFGIFDQSTFTSTTSAPLVSFTGSSATAGAPTGNFIVIASGLGLPPTVSLAGPLLSAVNTTLKNGDPTTGVPTFLFIGDSSKVSSTGSAPLLSLDGTSVDTAGGFLTVRRSLTAANPTRLTLGGPLVSAANGSSINVTSLGFGSACCTGVFVGQAAELISSGAGALIQLNGSTFNAGPDVQSGGNLVSVFDSGACCGDTNTLVAPSKVVLAGPLLSATNSSISALFNLLSVARSDVSSASADPVIQLSGTTVGLGGLNPFGNVQTSGRLLVLVSSGASGTVGSPASVSLTGAGPLLAATASNVGASSDLIGIFNGAVFTSAATVPLVQLTGGSITTQSTGGGSGYLLQVGGTGGPTGTAPSSAQLGAGLLRATGSLNLSGGLLGVFSGSQVTSAGSADPFVLIDGGNHVVAGNPAVGPGFAMFSLSGRNTTTALDAESGLSLGTDRPIQGVPQLDGSRPMLTPLLQTSGATVTGQKVLRIDNALLEATAPLLNLNAKGATQSVLTATGSNALDLTFATRVSALGSSLIRLDNSILNVANGSLVNVNASKLTVAGDLVNLVNGATLSILNGPLITVSGSGFTNITGGLINFGGTGGNTVNVTNNLCPCSLFGGVPVALQNGALGTNVQISSPIKNPGLGTVNLSPNAALAVVNGAGSKLTVGAQ